jgi:hypothetical protein
MCQTTQPQNGKSGSWETKEVHLKLIEYQGAQSSAQHHDYLVWFVTSIMWAGSLVLMGQILKVLDKRAPIFPVVMLAVLGITMTICVWVFTFQLRRIKNQKYARCKEIEKQLGVLEQHAKVQDPYIRQTYLYGVIMVLFLLA